MKKSEVLAAFGGIKSLAAELQISDKAIYKWPTELSQKYADWMNGVSWRVYGKPISPKRQS